MSRSRPRPSRHRAPKIRITVVLLVAIIAIYGLPSASFTTGELPRSSGSNVVVDTSGVVGLDVAASVSRGPQDWLMDVTNNYPEAIQVTVTLQDGGDGTLFAAGNSGDSVPFTVNSGDTEPVDIDVQGNPGTIFFTIDATIEGITFSATRQTETQGGGSG